MAGRGPRVGATGLVGLLGLVLAFILTTSVPFLGLPWFIIAAAGIGGVTYGVHRRLHVQLVTHNDIEAVTKREELVAAGRPFAPPNTGGAGTPPARPPHLVDRTGGAGAAIRGSARVPVP